MPVWRAVLIFPAGALVLLRRPADGDAVGARATVEAPEPLQA